MAGVSDGSVFALFVRPTQERMGIGTALMAKVEECLFRRHQVIWLTTEKQSRAQTFYQKRGWALVAECNSNEVKLEKVRAKRDN